MDSTRLNRIMLRQKELELKLREKEDKRLAQEKEKREARAEEVRKACAYLVRNHESFRKDDELVGGYRGADSCSHSVVKRSNYEVKVHNTQNMGCSKLVQGPFRGSEWTRTALGWMRIESPHSVKMYKQPCTKSSLPFWLYEELDVIFGMRRISSADFVSTCIILETLFHQYIGMEDTSKSVKKRMVLDIQLAIVRMKKNPECVRREQSLSQAVDILARLEKEIIAIYPNMSIIMDEIPPQPNASSATDWETDQEFCNICMLPEEIMLHILSFLYNPKDLCTAATVCVSWSTLANDTSLYSHFIDHLCDSLFIVPPESALPKKELFIQLWTHKIGAPTSGLHQCFRCRELYWIFKKSFCPGFSGFGSQYHVGRAVELAQITSILTNRVQYY